MADINKSKSLNNHSFFKGGGQLFCSNGSSKMKECFELFDANGDGFLDATEFECLLKSLFMKNDECYNLDKKLSSDMFKLLNEKQGRGIDLEVFSVCWDQWIKQIVCPVSALLVIDVQNDFISGSLAVKNCPAQHEGGEVVPVINRLVDTSSFDVVVYSCDWHPKNHISFIESVNLRDIHHTSKVKAEEAQTYDKVVFSSPRLMEQQLWPAHCVQDTWGAELHPQLKVVEEHVRVNKGTDPDIDSYSAFWDNQKLAQTKLEAELVKRGVTDVYVTGIAYDVCVGSTAMHALDHGFRTVVVDDACRGISLDGIAQTKKTLTSLGAAIVHSDQVADMVSGRDRRPDLGKFAADTLGYRRRVIDKEPPKPANKC